ncbi:hypothetical protein D9M68_18980 [compost metagenome]
MELLLIWIAGTLFSLFLVYCCWRVTYPIARGELHIAGQVWKYRIGRIPFFTAGKQYLFLFRGFVLLNENGLKELVAMSTAPFTWIEMTFHDYLCTHRKVVIACTLVSLFVTIFLMEVL